MGLEKYARRGTVDKRDKVIRARIPSDLYDEFKAHVDRLGLNLSEAVYLLIKDEMGRRGHKETTNVYVGATIEPQAATQRKQKQPRRRSGGRFTVAPWDVGGRVPCPICDQWYTRSNIARHAREHHGLTTQKLIEGNKEKADSMAAEARGGSGE